MAFFGFFFVVLLFLAYAALYAAGASAMAGVSVAFLDKEEPLTDANRSRAAEEVGGAEEALVAENSKLKNKDNFSKLIKNPSTFYC